MIRAVQDNLSELPERALADAGKAAYRKRKWIAEPPNGWIKAVLGFRQFSLRGLHKVQAEWKLVCAVLNHAAHGTDVCLRFWLHHGKAAGLGTNLALFTG